VSRKTPLAAVYRFADPGPADRIVVRPSSLASLTCEVASASLFGEAKVDGASLLYRLDLGHDAFRLRLSSGYDSGEVVLQAGRIEIKTR
jgi:hypothetical protein